MKNKIDGKYIFDLFQQLLVINGITMILLKNIYRSLYKQPEKSISIKKLSAVSSGFSPEEIDEHLPKLNYESYIDIKDDEVFITEKGMHLVKFSYIVKAIKITAGIIAVIAFGCTFINRYQEMTSILMM